MAEHYGNFSVLGRLYVGDIEDPDAYYFPIGVGTDGQILIANDSGVVEWSNDFKDVKAVVQAISGSVGGGGLPLSEVPADTGQTEIDTVLMPMVYGATWFYTVKKGSNVRTGNIHASWDGIVTDYIDTSNKGLGNTDGVEFEVIYNGSVPTLYVNTTTDGWLIKARRMEL